MTIPKTQTAYGFVRGKKTIQKFVDHPVAEPGPNEVLLKVEAVGLCASDIHLLWGQEAYLPDKFVMGHEIAGQIVKVGANLEDHEVYEIGARFCLTIPLACGACDSCRRGHDNRCNDNLGGYGITEDGGYQQYLLVKNLRTLLPLDDSISYAESALATDAVLTPFHSILKVKHLLGPTKKVLVIGLGGLGLNALQILRHYDVQLVAIDIKSDVKETALKFGAKEFYTDLNDLDHTIELFDFVFDFVGNQVSVDIGQAYVASGGKLMLVGLGKGRFVIKNFHLARREVEVIYSWGGTSSEQMEVLKWIGLGKIKPWVNTAHIDELPAYIDRLEKGQIQGRVVFRHLKL